MEFTTKIESVELDQMPEGFDDVDHSYIVVAFTIELDVKKWGIVGLYPWKPLIEEGIVSLVKWGDKDTFEEIDISQWDAQIDDDCEFKEPPFTLNNAVVDLKNKIIYLS